MIDEDIIEPFTSVFTTEYIDEIEKMYRNKPDGRKKKEYLDWKTELNRLITECNKVADFVIYKQLK